MFNRRTFDLIVLSLLHDHQEGLTAYQLLKLLKEHFTPLWNPSAGRYTLYYVKWFKLVK